MFPEAGHEFFFGKQRRTHHRRDIAVTPFAGSVGGSRVGRIRRVVHHAASHVFVHRSLQPHHRPVGGSAQGVDPHGVELGEEVQRTVFVPIAGKVFRRQVRPFVFARLGARRVGEHPLGGDQHLALQYRRGVRSRDHGLHVAHRRAVHVPRPVVRQGKTVERGVIPVGLWSEVRVVLLRVQGPDIGERQAVVQARPAERAFPRVVPLKGNAGVFLQLLAYVGAALRQVYPHVQCPGAFAQGKSFPGVNQFVQRVGLHAHVQRRGTRFGLEDHHRGGHVAVFDRRDPLYHFHLFHVVGGDLPQVDPPSDGRSCAYQFIGKPQQRRIVRQGSTPQDDGRS